MRRSSLLSLGIVFSLIATSTPAQDGARNANRRGSKPIMRSGTPLPVVDVHDEQGETISTASLRGKYHVLVFGCLT